MSLDHWQITDYGNSIAIHSIVTAGNRPLEVRARRGDLVVLYEPGHTAYLNRVSGSKYSRAQFRIIQLTPGGCANHLLSFEARPPRKEAS